MKLLILDQNFEAVDVVDTFESFIWTDRYSECGDFEIYLPATEEMLAKFVQDYYLWFDESDYLMIIEDVTIESDVEEGSHLTIAGRSLESILEKRIVWKQTILSGSTQDAIETLLNENLINPSDSDRKIDNFIFKESEDEHINELTIDAQYTGDNLYEVIQKICEEAKIGFRVLLNSDNQFVFELYNGTDRSYDQEENDYVVFSPKFDNILNSNYVNSKKTLKNVTLVGGEGEGADRKYITVGSAVGMERRELFTDASGVSSSYTDDGETKTIPETQYNEELIQKGKEELAKNKETKTFEGEVEATQQFKYREDFFIGDILQIVNEYGIESKTRIIEMVYSYDENGYSSYPTFSIVEDEEEEDEET